MNLDAIRDWISYDPESGEFTWIARPNKTKISVGDKAGNISADGKIYLKVKGTMYSGPKLAWWFCFGEYPTQYQFMTYKDGNCLNLRIDNIAIKSSEVPAITQAVLQEWFKYEGRQGVLIRKKAYSQRFIGQVNGSVDGDGYLLCSLFNKTFKVHRLIWILLNGEIPDDIEIDHKDRNRQNNRIENLRLVTKFENAQNKDWEDWYNKWFLGRHKTLPSEHEMNEFLKRRVDNA